MIKKYLFNIFIWATSIWGISACNADTNAEEAIRRRFTLQAGCWNKGDLECFMNGYWESDSLMFISKDQVIYGYNNTLERYKKSYPDTSVMGKLHFEIRHINQISGNAYFVVGRYYLKRKPDIGNAEGNFSLLWKKIKGKWVIVADHTS